MIYFQKEYSVDDSARSFKIPRDGGLSRIWGFPSSCHQRRIRISTKNIILWYFLNFFGRHIDLAADAGWSPSCSCRRKIESFEDGHQRNVENQIYEICDHEIRTLIRSNCVIDSAECDSITFADESPSGDYGMYRKDCESPGISHCWVIRWSCDLRNQILRYQGVHKRQSMEGKWKTVRGSAHSGISWASKLSGGTALLSWNIDQRSGKWGQHRSYYTYWDLFSVFWHLAHAQSHEIHVNDHACWESDQRPRGRLNGR
jgi:hypothetical protein